MPIEVNRRRTRFTSAPKSGPVFLGLFSRKRFDDHGNEVWIDDPISGSGPGWTFHDYTDDIVSMELTVDSTHRGPPYKDGSKFRNLTMIRSSPYGGVYGSGSYKRQDGNAIYRGGFHSAESSHFGLDFAISDIDFHAKSPHFPTMEGLGDKAYKGSKPKLEKVGGAVFLAEARDIPKMLSQTARGFHDTWQAIGGNFASKSMTPKGVADHFINSQFGWAPFLSDLSKFNSTFQNRNSIISRLTKDNGKSVRRRITLLDETSDELIGQGTGWRLYPNASLGAGFGQDFSYLRPGKEPTWELRETKRTHITGSGKFSYYRPEFDANLPDHSGLWNTAMRNAAIFGLRVNPSNLWKATPWSWAVDWMVNAGDHIDFLNDILVDSIACQYFFVMQHQVRTRVFSQTIPFLSGDVTMQFTRTIETKQREPSNSPFGPSLTWETLSPRQLAIAAALGISRS
jgi:hypothetical protein